MCSFVHIVFCHAPASQQRASFQLGTPSLIRKAFLPAGNHTYHTQFSLQPKCETSFLSHCLMVLQRMGYNIQQEFIEGSQMTD